jgi:hypothetical protein
MSTPPPVQYVAAKPEPPLPHIGYYIFAVVMPLFGLILGIQAAARNQTGPAFALWATSIFIGPFAWIVFWIFVAAASSPA